MEEEDLGSEEELQGYFSARVAAILKKYEKTPVLWNESLLSSLVPENAEIQYWTLNHRLPMEEWARDGKAWVYSDMFELYLDYPHSMTPLKKVYETVPHFGKEEWNGQMLGMEACMWCEHISKEEDLEKRIFPRILALAEITWGDCSRDYSFFRKRLTAFLPLLTKEGIRYTDPSWWDPEGKARREEAIGYFARMSSGVAKGTVQASKPGPEFAKSFVKKFFRPTDLLFLGKAMMK